MENSENSLTNLDFTKQTLTDEESNTSCNLQEITELKHLNVWGESQEVLEQQALQQLEIFTKEITASVAANETVVNNEIEDVAKNSTSNLSLNVTNYIKRQEELKKNQKLKVASKVTEKSKLIAERVSIKHNQNLSSKILEKKKHHVSKSKRKRTTSDSNYSSECSDDEIVYKPRVNKKKKVTYAQDILERIRDDGNSALYNERLKNYYKNIEQEANLSEEVDDIELSNGLKVSSKLWNNLYGYQRKGIKWLWKIHQEKMGGLLGDEMGLGKTVQIIVFLAALDYSRIISAHNRYTGVGPTLIVAPATVLLQWVKHFFEWAPEFRVAVLHQSGTYKGKPIHLIKKINSSKGILITTYSGILKYKGILSELCWHYLILDEGHKIRNSTAKVTVAVKQIRTPHRIILTGSPMQNNLQELWSLFDFIIPGMLGTLSTFVEHFANPIMQGGYANATPMQEATALSVATALKDLITPYLLRRSKNEVKKHISLPNKTEQVLFCTLTNEQRDLYKGYLMGEEVSKILGKSSKNWFSENRVRANVLVAITSLRKICNHPDLYLGEAESKYFDEPINEVALEHTFGYYKRSGKMVVVSALLKIWKKQKHRVLLFTQSRGMINIFEEFLHQQGYRYLKMDGSTNISSRQPLLDTFNQDSSYDVFLLTTRVGGLGVNLTGANRVIIYDPDWNPATDTQARERAWRIGQEKQVTVYRLISAGTIEEKMYQRQVWKQLLSNKVLLDPKTQKFFKTSDLYDLFSLQEHAEGSNPETANIFRNSRVNIQEKNDQKKQSQSIKKTESKESVCFSEEKIESMKNLAKEIAKRISNTNSNETQTKKKSIYQQKLEEEKLAKLEEKEKLKMFSPSELRSLNRKKAEIIPDDHSNKVDDTSTNISFSTALDVSEKTANIYHNYKYYKANSIECNSDIAISSETTSAESTTTKAPSKRKKNRDLFKVDLSGTIDGENIEGLVKREVNKPKHKDKDDTNNNSQDDYVLGKLFSKKGVHTALQHETIVQSVQNQPKIKIHWEVQQRTNLALDALKKSRLNSWRW